MSRTARQIQLRRFGGPEVLEMTSVELDDPGPDEVLLDVEWIGLNRAEILWREGEYLIKPGLPSPIGLECAGIVAEVGENVRNVSPGDHVGVVPATFDSRTFGCYAESMLIPARALQPTPGTLEGPLAAAVWMAYLTAWGGLLDVGGLGEGWHVVIPAASSSVGIAAIQFCLLEGAVPIAVTTRAEKAARLAELGAEHVIVSTTEDLPGRVREITEGKGARLFFDPVGGSMTSRELDCAAPGACIVLYGVLDREPMALDAGSIIGKSLRLEGYLLPRTTADPQVYDVAVGQIVDGLGEAHLQPVVDRVFPFDEISEAHRYMESGEHVGKIVVEVG